jgi:hypothetical protein
MVCAFGGGAKAPPPAAPAPPPAPPAPAAATTAAYNVIRAFLPQKTRRSTILTQNQNPYGEEPSAAGQAQKKTLLGTPIV